jgi:lipopolysaccharide/colanic/teichoic acid biosynthesis glycosyltransferase
MSDYSTVGTLLGVKSKRARQRRSSLLSSEAVFRPGVPFSEQVFQSILTHERRRAERSSRPFVLMLVRSLDENHQGRLLSQTISALISSTRESDLIGWYRESSVLGIIFTELDERDKMAIAEELLRKLEVRLSEGLGEDNLSKIVISVHVFPEDWDQGNSEWVGDANLYPDLQPKVSGKHFQLALKRVIDVVASAVLLLLTLPVLLVIAVAIKLTSKGPVLFEQERLGQFGARFKCLKFRTMYSNCDPKLHREYTQKFIAGNADKTQDGNPEKGLYKLTGDPRVTSIGRILRKTSLDEFPQFWNVLRGEMSLVGPRPPLPYEFEVYDLWHRRRVLELKPGITGLWQVSGRNRIRFEEMVRLDLRYSQKWSLWLDVKILLATPWAMFNGDCA